MMNYDFYSFCQQEKAKRHTSVRIPFVFKSQQFFLVLLTNDSIHDKEIIGLLSKWRREHQQWFQAQFPISEERTRIWLKKRVLEVKDRLLFLIEHDDVYYGHVGLFRYNIENKSIDIDNIIRGMPGFPGLMEKALEVLMSWTQQMVDIKLFTLQTSSDNTKAIRLYKRLGFRTYKLIPTEYKKTVEGGEWIEKPNLPVTKALRAHVYMKQELKKVKPTNLKKSNKKISFAGPSITQKEISYVIDGVKHGFYETFDQHTRKLEAAVCEYTGAQYSIATHCCTLALHLACETIGLTKGDEVICTDFSWVATAYAISYTGATPVFVDIDPNTWCIDPEAIEKAITPKTKAIMLVHTFGHPAQMDAILKIAKKYRLKVIEDAAPALGSTFQGQPVGTFGDIGCFSFQGAKIAVSGEGGMLVTNNKKLYDRAKLLASMGRTDSQAVFWSDELGYQYTMANLTASLALAQVERIEELVAKKRQIAFWYQEELQSNPEIKLIVEQGEVRSNYAYPSLLLLNHTLLERNTIIAELKKLNIHARPAFPRMSMFPLYKPPRFDNPHATRVARQGISLPSAANLTHRDIVFVSRTLQTLMKK
jgi:perosamine synthetase